MQHTCVPGPGNFSRKKTERENDSRLRVSAPHSHCTRRRAGVSIAFPSSLQATRCLVLSTANVIQEIPDGNHRRFGKTWILWTRHQRAQRPRGPEGRPLRFRVCLTFESSSATRGPLPDDKGQRSAAHEWSLVSDSVYFGTSLARTREGSVRIPRIPLDASSSRGFLADDTHLASPPPCRFGVAWMTRARSCNASGSTIHAHVRNGNVPCHERVLLLEARAALCPIFIAVTSHA